MPQPNPDHARRARDAMQRGDGWRLGLALCLVLLSRAALADTVFAPVGGHAIEPFNGGVACDEPGGGWTVEDGGRALRPPAQADAIGRPVVVRMASRKDECGSARAGSQVTLVAVGKTPAVDASQVVAEVDAGRLTLHGHDLKGAVLGWRTADKQGEDACVAPDVDHSPGHNDESCGFTIARGLTADPTALTLRLLPAGFRDGPGATLYDGDGHRVALDGASFHPARVILDRLAPLDASIDVSSGSGKVALPHADAVANVDCADATCDLADDSLLVTEEHGADESLDVRVHLRPRVVLRKGGVLDANPKLTLALQRCPVSVISATPLRRVGDQRVVVRVAGRCAADPSLDFATDAGPARVERSEARPGELLAVLKIAGALEGYELAVTVRRGATTVGTARVATRLPPSARVALELAHLGPIDFIPTNREARAVLPAIDGAELVVAAVEGAYTVRRDLPSRTDFVRGVEGATGSTALRLSYRDHSLPTSLGDLDLAEYSEPLQRPLHAANIPVVLGAAGPGKEPFAELVCGDGDGHVRRVQPGGNASIPYRARDTCRLVLHRERLREEDGVQALQLAVSVVQNDGTPRSEARLEQRMVVRAAPEPLSLFIHGVQQPFDRILVRLSLAADDTHYAMPLDERLGAPQLQWAVVAGTEHLRLYATTAFPTGLFRVADEGHSGILTLNAGALLRLVLLSREGHEFPLGLEAGVMWLGIAGDTEAVASPHGQVALVSGLGVGVPIANTSRSAQTSISLHAWFEYEVSRAVLNQAGSAFGFIFGPSITVGDLGLNF